MTRVSWPCHRRQPRKVRMNIENKIREGRHLLIPLLKELGEVKEQPMPDVCIECLVDRWSEARKLERLLETVGCES